MVMNSFEFNRNLEKNRSAIHSLVTTITGLTENEAEQRIRQSFYVTVAIFEEMIHRKRREVIRTTEAIKVLEEELARLKKPVQQPLT